MNTRNLIKILLVMFSILFSMLCVFLVYNVCVYGTRWFSSPYNTRVRAAKQNVITGSILDSGGVVLAYTDGDGERRYNENKSLRMSLSHTVGDFYGQTVGAESLYSKYLLGFDQSVIERISATLANEKRKGSDVYLTLDSSLCKYAYEQLNGRNGAVIVMNYKTGAIVASVSSPSFDPSLIKSYISGESQLQEGAMVNRSTMGQYTPGSVFKLVTTVAALRYIDGVEKLNLSCAGEMIFDKESGKYLGDIDTIDINTLTNKYITVADYQHTSHGNMDIKSAFAKSCNSAYAKLAMMIGSKNLYRTAKSLGIARDAMFSDIVAYSGSFTQGETEYETAWSGVGQYKDIVTPLNMCMLSAAIANNGVMQEPRLLLSAKAANDSIRYTMQSKVYLNAMTASESTTLREYMIEAVKNGTGKRAAISGFIVGGKTGTAEVAVNEQNESHAWFCGFVYSDEHPYAIAVVVEFGGSGGSIAAPIAKNVLSKAIKLP